MHIPQSHSISGNTITTSSTSVTTSTTSSGGITTTTTTSSKGKGTAIVSGSLGGSKSQTSPDSQDASPTVSSGGAVTPGPGSGSSHYSITMEHSSSGGSTGDKALTVKIKRTKPGTKGVDAKHEIVKPDAVSATTTTSSNSSGSISLTSTNPGGKAGTKADGTKTSHKEKDKEKTEDGGSGAGNDNGGKIKAQKRGSTHKKPKSGATPPTPTTPTSLGLSLNKKDRGGDSGTIRSNYFVTSSRRTCSCNGRGILVFVGPFR